MDIKPATNKRFINREISWLSFNERVLQEAKDTNVPVIQRLRFLGIFSNNLDEFFRVRVATTKRRALLRNNKTVLGGKRPAEILEQINQIVVQQQVEQQLIFRQIIEELKTHNIFLINEHEISEEHHKFIKNYFVNELISAIVPIMVQDNKIFPHLKDKNLYFAVKLSNISSQNNVRFALIEMPNTLPRFINLPPKSGANYLIMIDDVVRYCLHEIFTIFRFEKAEAYCIKITRDAELDIDDDISTSFMEKMNKSLQKRKRASAVRFIYDKTVPADLLKFLRKKLDLDKFDTVIAGARYHNFKDFIKFPRFGIPHLENIAQHPITHKLLKNRYGILDVIREHDILLHYPYQSFDNFLDMLREAAIDVNVKSIEIALYRVAEKSNVVNALINAAKNGKEVTVVIELLARFDEQANIDWSTKMQEEGIKVIHGVQALKVHCKVAHIVRKENGRLKHYAYIGTGNFNESTAKIYCDEGLFTADKRIVDDVARLFDFFRRNYKPPHFQHLIISPFNTRQQFEHLIDFEISQAAIGKPAWLKVKLNSLVDEQMMNKLYLASSKGVKIQLIIRGICSLIPKKDGLSDNVEAISIVDKYLEHSRLFIFYHDGNTQYFISSADWMTRNLDARIETTCPIFDRSIQNELLQMFEIQWNDNVKARLHSAELQNVYRKNNLSENRAQEEFYKYLQKNHSIDNNNSEI